jgi:hypothetical protein
MSPNEMKKYLANLKALLFLILFFVLGISNVHVFIEISFVAIYAFGEWEKLNSPVFLYIGVIGVFTLLTTILGIVGCYR